ncbi:MAG: hypothetical protein RI973_2409 [Bacteroidota bacterium]|jgi:hypothetical protein
MSLHWFFLSFSLLLGGLPAGRQDPAIAVEWLVPRRHDFGELPPGVPAVHLFHFKNTGASPLQVETVRTTCGCTASDWPEEPVLPGQSAAVRIEYDAAKSGRFQKKVTVFFYQLPRAEKLWIEGVVQP